MAGIEPASERFDPRKSTSVVGRGSSSQRSRPTRTLCDQPLIFRAWRPADTLSVGPFGTLQPEATRAEVEPDLLLVPFLAADRDGYRLGYGAGYYDRTLDHLRARRPVQAVGVGFDLQRLESVPRDAGDQRLDWLLTEAGAFAFV